MDRTRFSLLLLASLFFTNSLHAQGILVHDAATAGILDITHNSLHITVEDQIAVIHSTQHFVNTSADTLIARYAYPLGATSSATAIRWAFADSIWHNAMMVVAPQDTVLPGSGAGGSVHPTLDSYLGDTPLYFTLPTAVLPNEEVTVELSFVMLLPYANARVEFLSTSNYGILLSGTLRQTIDVRIRSQRAITGLDIDGLGSWDPSLTSSYLTTDSAGIFVDDASAAVNSPFVVGYDLDPLAYGLVAISNYLPDTLVKCDEMGNGFFVVLIEPEPTSEVVQKDIVIVIDKSGSMSGTKIQDAKAAAQFMVDNLNSGDHFNVLTFNDAASSWSPGLQPFNAATLNSAQSWIGSVSAGGGTNINSAITMGIQDFNSATPGSARTMVFLTDGQDSQPNNVILSNALNLRTAIVPDLQIFTFGIGSGFNEQLLNQLAVQNNGVSQFLGSANFLQVMNDFFVQINDPVMLNPVVSFSQQDIEATYPQPLQGLFVGQQMVIVGRYDVPGVMGLHLEGVANGQSVTFDHPVTLTSDFDIDRMFIPKIWAQYAVQDLMNEYYSYPTTDPLASMLEDSVVSFSMCYGVGSPFTSFTDPGPGNGGTTVGVEEETTAQESLVVYPDPSSINEPITFDLSVYPYGTPLTLRLFDALGREVFSQDLRAFAGNKWVWDGRDAMGQLVRGALFFAIDDGGTLRTGRITRL